MLKYRFIPFLALLLLFASCKSSNRFTVEKKPQYKIAANDSLVPDSAILNFIQPYKEKLDSSMNIRLCSSEMVMGKDQPESLLGNFVADLCLKQAEPLAAEKNLKIDFCFFNNGGLRNTLPAGNILMRNIYELMPFDNELVLLVLDGNTTLQLINTIIENGGVPVSGIRILINKTAGAQASVQGKPFELSRDYVVLTSDYLANGGDKYDFLKNRKAYIQTGLLMRDAIINHCRETEKSGKKISSALDKRIRYE
jgi:2',3'-cyclic-nucleotide 2'-phosphodiesterase (5'-nucleotidase family)